jgi:uridine kinase
MIDMTRLLHADTAKNGIYPTICIDGRGGSGKTSFADFLACHLTGFTVIHGDDYFEPNDDQIAWGDFNEPRFEADVLSKIRAGQRRIPLRPFDYPNGCVGDEVAITVERGLIVERWFGFTLNIPRDISIWVETPQDICLARGLARDGSIALGDRAQRTWEEVWQPRENRYIEAYAPADSADIVVDGTVPFEEQFHFSTPN